MREGCSVAEAELERVEKEYAEMSAALECEMSSLKGAREDLEYRVSVGASECAKWTDNTLQVC